MGNFTQYVDSLIRNKELALEYIRLHNEWKLLKAEEVKEKVIQAKERFNDSQKEIKEIFDLLIEKGFINGGNREYIIEYNIEMGRFAKWLSENFILKIAQKQQKKNK